MQKEIEKHRKKMEGENHILVIPFPVQGHINPMLQFSKRLASKGARVTLVTLSSISNSMGALQASSVNFETISDGVEEGKKLESMEARAKNFPLVVSQSLAELIERQNGSKHPPKLLVYDSFMPWAVNVAKQFGLDGAAFFTQSCGVNAIYYHAHQGAIRMPLEGSPAPLPSMPPLGINDMPSFLCDTASYPAFLHLVLNQFSNFEEAKWLLYNTFESLEDEVGYISSENDN
jgi:pathogen-inducible salicylic acid glucosyltransferase